MRAIQKLRGIVSLFRPELPFAAGVCVVVGEIIALAGLPSLRVLSLGFLAGFFLASPALILNDYFDLEVDKVNMPERPLPAGLVSPREALILTAVTTVIGLAAGYALGPTALILSIVMWCVGVLYNWRFRSRGLAGNLMVASCVASTFVLGGIAAGAPLNPAVWFFALTAFLIDLGEEIAGDAMDMQGDLRRDSQSLAIRMGRDFALKVSGLTLGLVVLISPIPMLLGWTEGGYVVVLVVVDVVVLFFTVRLVRSRTPEEGRRAMRGIYLGPLLGMLVFIVVRFFG